MKMYFLKNVAAKVINSNSAKIGKAAVNVYFEADGPLFVEYKDETYLFTGKSGTDSETDVAVREMAIDAGSRLWIALDGQTIWED